MAFMNKETLIQEAERLGVDIDGLPWQQAQKAVIAAQKESGTSIAPVNKGKTNDQVAIETSVKQIENTLINSSQDTREQKDQAHNLRDQANSSMVVEGKAHRVGIKKPDMPKIWASPEMWHEGVQVFGYEEDIGEEVIPDLKAADRLIMNAGRNTTDDVQKIEMGVPAKGKTGKRQIIKTGLPVEMASVVCEEDDPVWRVRYRGMEGYLWKHNNMENVAHLLHKAGRYHDFASQFASGNMFYLTGLLCVDIEFTKEVFRRIEREAQRDAKIFGQYAGI